LPTETSSPTATITPTLTPFPSLTPTTTPTLTRLDQSIVDVPIAAPAYKQCDRMDTQKVFPTDYAVYDAIKTLDPIADGFAEAMDWTCTDINGDIFRYAISIWFYIDNKIVASLNDYEAIGSWIVDVMNLLDTIPRDKYTMYAEPSNVIFTFWANSESLEIAVPINKYWEQADGKTSEEIFKMFYIKP
jgi:hypothetical protein